MIVNQNQLGLLMRYSNYRSHSFIGELMGIIASKGYTWFFKVGKAVPQNKLENIIKQGGFILLKGPKSDGDLYFYAHVIEAINGTPKNSMSYPAYYSAMVKDETMWMIESLEGTWMKTDCICPLTAKEVSHLFLASNNKSLNVAVHSTRSATMYVYSDVDFYIENRDVI